MNKELILQAIKLMGDQDIINEVADMMMRALKAFEEKGFTREEAMELIKEFKVNK